MQMTGAGECCLTAIRFKVEGLRYAALKLQCILHPPGCIHSCNRLCRSMHSYIRVFECIVIEIAVITDYVSSSALVSSSTSVKPSRRVVSKIVESVATVSFLFGKEKDEGRASIRSQETLGVRLHQSE